jgi:hypothetical protein
VNDEEQPSSEAARLRMLAKIKGSVVNIIQSHLAKFNSPVVVEWVGRIVMTLNDDAGSVGLLPEVCDNSSDKICFFKSKPYAGIWPVMEETESIITKTLPFFAHWLLNKYIPPKEIMTDPRCGVRSFFDPHILELSNHQTYSTNLAELIEVWKEVDSYWAPDQKNDEFIGTPTALLSVLQSCAPIVDVARKWTQQAVAKSLTSLAKQAGSGVTFNSVTGREFKISR